MSICARVIRRAGAEAWWWLSGAGRLWWRHRVGATLYPLAAVGAFAADRMAVLVLLTLPVVAVGVWARLSPASYGRWLAAPLARFRMRRRLRRSWPVVMESVGLARRTPSTRGPVPGSATPADRVEAPGLARLRWDCDELLASPRLLVGQTVDDVEAAADRLRVCLAADRIRVVPNQSRTGCVIVWCFGDPLAAPVAATVPPVDAPVGDLDRVPVGVGEDGRPWRLPVRISTLGAGCSGAGKSSLMQALLIGLGPAIHAGLVRVYGIDLKGGMELAMSRPLFSRYATTPGLAVAMLERLVDQLHDRAARQAGITRQHTPTLDEPLVLVLVDELAALVAYQPDRDLLRRAEAALNVLLSQGRAVGFVVFGFVQDPRKETVKMRHLFLQTIALRLREREEVTMVLSDGAVNAGAWCHKIPPNMPGVGYLLGEDGRPVRVRAFQVTDDSIRLCADRFHTIGGDDDIPLVEPDVVPLSGRTSRRRPRTAEPAAASGEPDSAKAV